MNDYNIPIIEPPIDYTKVPAINQKRIISFFNQFVVHTVTFLNKFSLFCEEKLFEFENKLQKVEASLELLESRLNSVPGLDVAVKNEIGNTIVNAEKPLIEEAKEGKAESQEAEAKEGRTEGQEIEVKEENIQSECSNKTPDRQESVKTDPQYAKYFKLLRIGAPKEAFMNKMIEEGLDPSLLN
ncbi:WASH complex subunit 3 [Prorops nasuta]|uniref:WASH complex subunit 3 n=1 Tax=Prorops nasuta TaxID=863751 RepID=UPI0034CDE87B